MLSKLAIKSADNRHNCRQNVNKIAIVGHKHNCSAQEEVKSNEKRVSTPIEDKVLAKFEDIVNDINSLTKLFQSLTIKSKIVTTKTLEQINNVSKSLAVKTGTVVDNQHTDEEFKTPIVNSLDICRPNRGPNVSGVCGLNNLGNTCYMNAVLQCMSNIRPLTEFVRKFANNVNINGQSLLVAYSRLMGQLWSTESKTVSPNDFHLLVLKLFPEFRGFGPKDCSQLLSKILSRFEEELNQLSVGRKNSYHSFISNTFHGFERQLLVCSCGRIQSEELVSFDVLNLPQLDCRYSRILIIRLVIKNEELNEIELRFNTPVISMSQLLAKVAKIYWENTSTQLNDRNLIAIEVFDNKIRKFLRTNGYLELEDLYGDIYVYVFDPLYPIHIFVVLFGHNPMLLDIEVYAIDRIRDEVYKQIQQNIDDISGQQISELNSVINFRQDTTHRCLDTTFLVVFLCCQKALNFRQPDVYRLNSSHLSRLIFDVKLEEYLRLYVTARHHKEGKAMFCDKCQKTPVLMEKREICRVPEVLTIRFDTNAEHQNCFQSYDCIIPQVLNFNNYITGGIRTPGEYTYDLIGTVNRQTIGTHPHYSSYAKNYLNNKWHYFADNYVIEVNESQMDFSNNYLLIYLKR